VADDERFTDIVGALRAVVPVLHEAGIPYALAGSMACWAHGGPQPFNDLDLVLKPEDADAALEALGAAGFEQERPPERWLVKAYHGGVLVDLIFDPLGGPVTDELLASAETLDVLALRVPVLRLEDVFTSKLLALGEHQLDLGALLTMARPVREQVDWDAVRRRTGDSPYARAFFVLLEELGLVPSSDTVR
jgi:hypothetical protein